MAAIGKASQASWSETLPGPDSRPPTPPPRKQWFIDKGPMGDPQVLTLQTLALKEPHDAAFYQANNRRSGCFPIVSHGRPQLAQVASTRLRQGVSVPGARLFRGFDNTYDHVQVAGLNQSLDARGQLPNPMVWLMTHTREPDDGMIMGALHGVLPLARDGRGGHRLLPRFVMRKSNSTLERFSKFLGMGCFSVNVATGDSQKPGDKRANAATLQTLNGQMAHGDHPHIFVEAKIRGDGMVQVPPSCGAVMKCRQVVKPPRGIFRRRPALQAPVPMLPVALTYEVFGRDKPVALFSAGPTFAVTGEGPKVAQEVQRMLARNNTLSLSGLLGAFVLDRLYPGAPDSLVDSSGSGPLVLSPASIEALLAACVGRLRAAQDFTRPLALNEVAVDVELLDPAKRAAMAHKAFAQLQALGHCDAAGVVQAAQVGPRANQDKPLLFKEQPFNVHRDQPLRYWGNRVLQQTCAMPELRAVLREAYASLPKTL